MYTYQNIIELLEWLGNHHPMVQTVESGDIWEGERSTTPSYPLFFIQYQDFVCDKGSKVFNFKLIASDLQDMDKGNRKDVFNDCEKILVDVISWFKKVDISKLNVEDRVTIQPFVTGMAANAVGLVADVNVRVPFNWGCNTSMLDSNDLEDIKAIVNEWTNQ